MRTRIAGASLSLFDGFRVGPEGRVRAQIRHVSFERLTPIVMAVMKTRPEPAERA
jgi:hypothetical protein